MGTILSSCMPRRDQKSTVTLKDGSQLQGLEQSNGIRIFRNVPYAEPPVGELRFRPPVAKSPWTGVWDCTREGAVAFQLGSVGIWADAVIQRYGFSYLWTAVMRSLLKVVPLTSGREDEDCLTLRVLAQKGSEKRPVMVWFHAGNFEDGSCYDACSDADEFAKMGMVMVYVEYRLNVFGNFSHPELAAETPKDDTPWGGDAGLRDQVLSLQWVRDNISHFGGDPENVTLYGVSAGAESVVQLMCTQASKGLFHKAIAGSPGCTDRILQRRRTLGPLQSAEDRGVSFATFAVGAYPGQLERLRRLPAKKLQRLYQQWRYEKRADGPCGFFRVSGSKEEDAMLPENVFSIFAQGKQHPVPLLIGIAANEGVTFREVNMTVCSQKMERFYHPLPCANQATQAGETEAYSTEGAKKLLELYPGLDGSLGEKKSVEAFESIYGDLYFGRCGYLLASLHSTRFPTFFYRFSRGVQRPGSTLGSFHASDIDLVHGAPSSFEDYDDADLLLGKTMRKYWTHFAATGKADVDGLPRWYGLHEQQSTMQPTSSEPLWMKFDRHQVSMEPVAQKQHFEVLLEPLRLQLQALDDEKLRTSLINGWLGFRATAQGDGDERSAVAKTSNNCVADPQRLLTPRLMATANLK
eukprot:TRINITY_DN81814_c0_g1_i1.p1 TRINITY_DN81814_c0_g1~~TRINITY_DN81814_c0_g1_i1.p1  ORF type:complete len:636 (-),score=116.83 TRINITY_DN81814_c0_g1_i1:252-2159(-)